MTNGTIPLSMNIGGAMTAPLIVVLTAHYGWQAALMWIALPTALLTGAWAWYGRDTPKGHPKVTRGRTAELEASDLEKPAPMTLARHEANRRAARRATADVRILLPQLRVLPARHVVVPVPGSGTPLHRSRERLRRDAAVDRRGLGAGVGGLLADRLGTKIGYRWGYRLVPIISLPLAGVLLLVAVDVAAPYAAVLALMATFFMIELERRSVLGGDDAGGTFGHGSGHWRAEHRRQFRRHGVGADHWGPVGRGPLACDVRDRRRVRVRWGGVLVRHRPRPEGGHLKRTPPRGGVVVSVAERVGFEPTWGD